MKRFFIFLLIMGAGVGAVYEFLPPETRNKTIAFLRETMGGNTETIRDSIKNRIIPADPKEKREMKIAELKDNLAEIKKHISDFQKINQDILNDKDKISSSTRAILEKIQSEKKLYKINEIIKKSEDSINQLEKANQETSTKGNAAQRILDGVFPPKAGDCRK